MKLYAEGKLVAVEKGSFTDQATGLDVLFYKNFLQCEDESVVNLGSGKTDLSKYIGKKVVCHIDARQPQGEKLYKLTIREMNPVEVIDPPEEEIE